MLDRIEQAALLGLYIWLTYRLWPESLSRSNLYLILLLVSESLVVSFVLIRKPTEDISSKFGDWLIAFAATCLPLMVDTGRGAILPSLGVFLLIFGTSLHILAKMTLFRSFGVVPANRGVKTKGLYALVRHPIYAGYFCTHLGYLLNAPTLWNTVIYLVTWALLAVRIHLEEELLSRSPDYADYMKRVRFRVLPGIY